MDLYDKDIISFEPGDIVRIRDDINPSMMIPLGFVTSMEKYRGHEFIIDSVDEEETAFLLSETSEIVSDLLDTCGITYDTEKDIIHVRRYRLIKNDPQNENDITISKFVWSIYMFDLSCIDNVEYELEDIDLLFEELLK